MRSSHFTNQSSSDDITAAAVEWLLERQEGFAPGRAAAFQAWCDADPQHALAAAKAERTLALLGELPELKESLSARLEEAAEREPQPAGRPFWLQAAAWTAAAAVVALAAVWWRPTPEARAREFNYVSNADRPQQVILGDGSFVDLNSNTTIRTQMLPRERRVVLQEGEAHFAVAHDTSRPFIVEAAGVLVRAVGTAFTVRVGEQRVEVLVLEGKVEISEARPGAAGPTGSRPRLGIADRAVISRTGSVAELLVEKMDPGRMREARAWHSLVTTISSRPLREIVELFNRRNPVRLVIADAELAERNFGGSFALDQPRTFIRALELDGDVISEPRGGNEIVLRRRP